MNRLILKVRPFVQCGYTCKRQDNALIAGCDLPDRPLNTSKLPLKRYTYNDKRMWLPVKLKVALNSLHISHPLSSRKIEVPKPLNRSRLRASLNKCQIPHILHKRLLNPPA
eukprot:TRINITY_DN26422_c0_g1_i2.p1 TRINITY_DN26422_c0_g1~~TRINITY_DN26422_c0_g1_i2.p1  ORF type:complete len:111 (+),score=2.07 TRINITY_DN26422_c0_g1_i2:299-631(+)